ncbi:MAG: hypothetical protein MK524_16790 [SAR202 cluster bacterium]|nr:hypothetical protein [SAR202 cluster bacterium]
MRPTNHALLATGTGAAIWALSGELLAVPLTFATGVLVDADHLPDQIWHFYLKRRPRRFIVLHAWEWLVALSVATVILSFPWWMVAVTLGYATHILTDHHLNMPHRWGYFLTYRAYHRFRIERISPDWRIEDPLQALLRELRIRKDHGDDSQTVPSDESHG